MGTQGNDVLKTRKLAAAANSNYTVFLKESVRYIMMLYKQRTGKGALAIIGDIEKLLPKKDFTWQYEYAGRKDDGSEARHIILDYDMLKNFIGKKQTTPNEDNFYFILVEFIKRQTVLEGYDRLLAYPETAVMYGDVFSKLCRDRKTSTNNSIVSSHLGHIVRSIGIMVFPTHDMVCMLSKAIPGTNYHMFRIIAFEPSYITSDLKITPYLDNLESRKLYETIFERFYNRCKTFLNHPYFDDYTGIMVQLSNQYVNRDGLMISDHGRSCPILVRHLLTAIVDKQYWPQTISFIPKLDNVEHGHYRFNSLSASSNLDSDSFAHEHYYQKIGKHDIVKIPIIVNCSADDKVIESNDFLEFFDSMLPPMPSLL